MTKTKDSSSTEFKKGASASINKTITDIALILLRHDFHKDIYPPGKLRKELRKILKEIIYSARPHISLSGDEISRRTKKILDDKKMPFAEKALSLCLLKAEKDIREEKSKKKSKKESDYYEAFPEAKELINKLLSGDYMEEA